jgi:hypothetical protein
MSGDFAAILTPEYVQTAAPSALLADVRGWIEATRRSSLIHPHGFLVLLLCHTEREEWRFHVWPRGTRLISGLPGPIHTHSRFVDSRVLKGELTNVVYSIAEAPTGRLPVYEVKYPGDKYDPQAMSLLKRSSARVDATVIAEQRVRTGERYVVSAHVFHQAVVPKTMCTCTIVRMHSPTPGPVKVIGIDGYPDTIGLRRVQCSGLETIAAALM